MEWWSGVARVRLSEDGAGEARGWRDGSLEIKNPSSQASLGLSVEHGGDFVLDQRMTAYSRTQDEANYKSVMVADKASQHQSDSFCGSRGAERRWRVVGKLRCCGSNCRGLSL